MKVNGKVVCNPPMTLYLNLLPIFIPNHCGRGSVSFFFCKMPFDNKGVVSCHFIYLVQPRITVKALFKVTQEYYNKKYHHLIINHELCIYEVANLFGYSD